MKRLTVIVPTYNHEKYIIECLSHIVTQKTKFEFDVVVYDDASTDNTAQLAYDFAKSYANVTVIRNSKNKGMLHNYRKAFSDTNTEFVAICEGDDYWVDNNKLQKQVDLLDKYPDTTMCFHQYYGMAQWDGSKIKRPLKHTYSKKFLFVDDVYNVRVIGNFSVCVYRSKYIRNVPESYYETKDAADFLFNLYILSQGKGVCLPEECSCYRIHDASQWSSLTPQEQLDMTLNFVLNNSYAMGGKYNDGFISIIRDAFVDFSPHSNLIKNYKFCFLGIPFFRVKVNGGTISLYLFGMKIFSVKKVEKRC